MGGFPAKRMPVGVRTRSQRPLYFLSVFVAAANPELTFGARVCPILALTRRLTLSIGSFPMLRFLIRLRHRALLAVPRARKQRPWRRAASSSNAESRRLPPTPAKVVLTKQGPQLVDLKGMTLYHYERDTTGKTSTCNGKCTESWVPLAATADARAVGDFTVIDREDGTKMWAYRYRRYLHLTRRQGTGRYQRQCHDAAMAYCEACGLF